MKNYILFVLTVILVSSCTDDLNVPYDWCYILDYTTSMEGTSIGTGSWVEGSGLRTDNGELIFVYLNDNYVNWTQAIVEVEMPPLALVNLSVQGGFFGTTVPYSSVVIDTTSQTSFTSYFYPEQAGTTGRTISMILTTLPIYTIDLVSIEIRGTGVNPFDENDCADDPTPTPTLTPLPSDSNWITFSDDDGSFQDYITYGDAVAPVIVDIGATHYDVLRATRQCCNASGFYYLNEFTEVEFDDPVTITSLSFNYWYSRSSDNGTPAYRFEFYDDEGMSLYFQSTAFGNLSSWANFSGSFSISDVSKVVVWLSRAGPAISSNAQLRLDNINLEYYYDSGESTPTPTNVATRTPVIFPYTNTPEPTDIFTPYVSPTPTLTPSQSHTPSPTFTPSNTPEYIVITDDTVTPPIFNPFQWLIDIWNTIMGFLNGIFELIGQIWNIFVLLIEIIFALIGLLLAWILDALGRLWALLLSFFTTPSIPIPGFPMCVSAPLDHQLCAIYFIADWTLLAPNTYGAFIVPLVQAFMNTILIFIAVRYIFTIIRRGEDVTR